VRNLFLRRASVAGDRRASPRDIENTAAFFPSGPKRTGARR